MHLPALSTVAELCRKPEFRQTRLNVCSNDVHVGLEVDLCLGMAAPSFRAHPLAAAQPQWAQSPIGGGISDRDGYIEY